MGSNAMAGGIYSSVQPNMLGLEMSLNNNLPPPQNPQNPNHMPHHHHPTAAFAAHDGDYHPQPHQPVKQAYPKSKNQSLTLSDEDEPVENSADDGKRKVSPWQRMKWTDNMVRLLIMVVFYIGDEVGSDANDPAAKKKSGGLLQKKGKWKSVSRAMMERGFYVSPQQCEDKFNDLNKRYKRVNDILGKGTSCRVVENQSLLDTMDLSPKMKEEVKKLLNSKHLFFREMCAYHNSCGHGAAEPSPPPPQRCLHSEEKAPIMPSEGCKKGTSSIDEDEDDEDDEEDEDEEGNEDEENELDEKVVKKRARKGTGMIEQLEGEINRVCGDGSKSVAEKRRWVKGKMVGLEERRVGIETQSFELEKQRVKWVNFMAKKEREMERERLANERVRLENERMVLMMRQKEVELMDHYHHSSNNRADPSSITG